MFICFILGFGCGASITYSKGFADGVIWSVNIGMTFVDFEVDEEAFKDAILQYRYHIENALIYDDEGNKVQGGQVNRRLASPVLSL